LKETQRSGRRASLDGGDGLVDLEHLGDRDTALGAEIVVLQAAKDAVTKKPND
jgi:hypothetical protein